MLHRPMPCLPALEAELLLTNFTCFYEYSVVALLKGQKEVK